VTRMALATLAMPFAAATMIGGILVATHHTHHRPAADPFGNVSRSSQVTASVRCQGPDSASPSPGSRSGCTTFATCTRPRCK
jgi:hypothetical protein